MYFIKRLFDIVVAFTVLLTFSPLLLAIAVYLGVKFGFGNVFFKQKRTGLLTEIFYVNKFQTMSNERDDLGSLLPDSKRITKMGNFLRQTSLDELPQLFNVLKGDMSLVGPRPLLPKYLPLYSQKQNRRHEVKPGITGWAQVNGRNNISWSKKFELDVWYVDNQSILLDLKILWLTAMKVIRRKDIYADDPQTFKPFNGKN